MELSGVLEVALPIHESLFASYLPLAYLGMIATHDASLVFLDL